MDAGAPGVEEKGAEIANELPGIVSENDSYGKCKNCGSPDGRYHSELWSDGLFYSDFGCSKCGYWEVYE